MFCKAKRDIFVYKCDIYSLRSYAICCPRATQCDSNPFLVPLGTYRTEGISLSEGKYRKSRKGFISQNTKSVTLSGNRFCYFIRNYAFSSCVTIRKTHPTDQRKMITQMNFCFDFLLLYLWYRGIIQKKTLNTMCYRLLEVGHWNIKKL